MEIRKRVNMSFPASHSQLLPTEAAVDAEFRLSSVRLYRLQAPSLLTHGTSHAHPARQGTMHARCIYSYILPFFKDHVLLSSSSLAVT